MKNLCLLNLVALATLFTTGCGDGGSTGTAQDKATLDRVSKEGLGPPTTPGDAYQNTNKKGGMPGNPPPPGSEGS